ncbi:peptidoglycan/LPS O-acetylase OafA/YrhL [Microbacterium trichothecenolyticum]|uniref:acyltransferase family protein n=1 Tax=Microbacterium trichothecenolyticum TaxID=69370 RepID=UPI0028589787|nr:acyltransferase family protein [Microbacterium trichothecenolyticum]MDR7184873.1 peptidoglycan/LPS O-acetylase OafA/YrhL [Microbacterium trichothecenolyticum]
MTSTAPTLTPPARFAGLDGMRAIAVLLVVVYHLFPPALLPGGFVGVDVFFVISGFLITSLLLREQLSTGRVALGRFWQRRARRLLPALAVVVVVCSALAWIVGGDVLVDLDDQVLGAATFSYNWVSVAGGGGYFAAATPELFRNFWSLAVEEQFYVLWPLIFPLFLLLPRTWARSAAAFVLAAASAVWMGVAVSGGGDVTRAYFGTDTHAFGLLLGVGLAFLLAPLPSLQWAQSRAARDLTGTAGALALGGLVVLAMVPQSSSIATFPGALLAASLLGAVAIVAGVWPGSWFGRAIDVRPMRWIGDRSYGIYLWHWPLLVLAVAVFAPDATVASAPVWIGLGVLAATAAASALSFRYIETPVRRHGFRTSARLLAIRLQSGPGARLRAVGMALSAALVLAGAGTAIAVSPDETSAEAAVAAGRAALEKALREAPAPIAPTPSGTDAASPAAADITGDQISAVGDSVMLASAGGLVERLPGIDVDAEVSRSMWAGPDIVDDLDATGRLRPYVVVALGTNGAVDPSTLEQLTDTVGPKRNLVLVNAYAPRDWIPGVNAELAAFAEDHRNVIVADWSGAIAPHEDLLAGDRIHPGAAGGRIFADTVAAAVDELADERRAYAADRADRLAEILSADLTP